MDIYLSAYIYLEIDVHLHIWFFFLISTCFGKCFLWGRKQLPTPVFWPGEFHGLYSLWVHKQSNTTERLSLSLSVSQAKCQRRERQRGRRWEREPIGFSTTGSKLLPPNCSALCPGLGSCSHWKREQLPTPVFWPGEFHELSWGHKELDTTEQL